MKKAIKNIPHDRNIAFKEDIKTDENDAKARPKWDVEKKLGFWSKRNLKRKPELSFFITMFFPNGTMKEWVILHNKKHFSYGSGKYIIDTTDAWFDLVQNQFRLYYKHGEPLPISRDIRVWVSEGNEHFLNIKADNVMGVIEQEYIKIITKESLSKYIIFTLAMVAFNCFLIFIMSIFIFLLGNNVGKLIPK